MTTGSRRDLRARLERLIGSHGEQEEARLEFLGYRRHASALVGWWAFVWIRMLDIIVALLIVLALICGGVLVSVKLGVLPSAPSPTTSEERLANRARTADRSGLPGTAALPAVFTPDVLEGGAVSRTEGGTEDAAELKAAWNEHGNDSLPKPDVVAAPNLGEKAAPRDVVLEVIHAAARARGLSAARMVAVAFCESSLRSTSVGDGGAAVGLWQFHLRTWYASAARARAGVVLLATGRDAPADPDHVIRDYRADVAISTFVAAHKWAGEGPWAWTCAREERGGT